MRVELCSETGICSILKEDGKKVDLIQQEVDQIVGASGDEGKIKQVIAGIDSSFAENLSSNEITQMVSEMAQGPADK